MKKKTKEFSRLVVKDVSSPSEKTVEAVVTAPTTDRDGDVIDTASLRLPLKGGGFIYAKDLTGEEELSIPFQADHSRSVNDTIGSARKGYINDAGELVITFGLSSRAKAKEMHTLLTEGHLDNAFSISFLYDWDSVEENKIYNAEVVEISLVWRGSNYDARLLSVSKSLLEKGEAMTKKMSPELEAKLKELADLNKEVEELQATEAEQTEDESSDSEESDESTDETQETEDSKDATNEEEAEDDSKDDSDEATGDEEETDDTDAKSESEESDESTDKETADDKSAESVKKMDKNKSIAATQAGAKANQTETPEVKVKLSKEQARHEASVLLAKQINAFNAKDFSKVKELNERARKLDKAFGMKESDIKNKELSYTDGSPLYLAEVLSNVVEDIKGDYGSLASQVTRINLTQSPKFRYITKNSAPSFGIPGFSGAKPQGDTGFSSVSLEPKPFALIQVWNDHAEEDAAVNLVNILLDNVAEAKAALEDELVATFTTATASDGTVYPTQGLIPRIAGGRTVSWTTSDNFITQFGAALKLIKSGDRKNVSLTMNSADWIDVALMRDVNGRPLFEGSGDTFKIGQLGAVRVNTSDEVPVGSILVGNLKRFHLGSKGGLQLSRSNEATLGIGAEDQINLWETDHSALRAVVRYEGDVSAAALANSFALMTKAEASS